MPYQITRADLGSISDVELAFATERLLPAWEDIPEDFKRGNLYTKIAEAIFYGRPMPELEMAFFEGFRDDGAAGALNKCVRAHLQSFGPNHQHKIAGVGFMMAHVFALQSVRTPRRSEA